MTSASIVFNHISMHYQGVELVRRNYPIAINSMATAWFGVRFPQQISFDAPHKQPVTVCDLKQGIYRITWQPSVGSDT